MENIELNFLSHIVHGDIERILKCEVPKEILPYDIQQAYIFVHKYTSKYKKLPSRDVVFTETNISLAPPEGDYQYVVDEIQDQHFYKGIHKLVSSTAGNLKEKNFDAIKDAAHEYSKEVFDLVFTDSGTDTFFNQSENVKVAERYHDRKLGKMGIQTPWKTINDNTMGWNGGDFTLFVAAPGVGKTFLLLMLALSAWEQKKKVLFVSPEMSTAALKERMASIILRLNYEHIRKGQLSNDAEKRYMDLLMNIDQTLDDCFYILGRDLECKLSTIMKVTAQIKPDIVFIDGVYMVSVPEAKNKFEKADILAEKVKGMAIKYDIPFICSTQFNREGRKQKFKDASLANIALSDAFAWFVDWAFGISKDDTDDNLMVMKPMKTREGESFPDFKLNWNFRTQDFSELGNKTVEDNRPIF